MSGYNLPMSSGYPEQFVAPMRAELTRLGVEELRTAEAGRCRGQVHGRHADDGRQLSVRLRGRQGQAWHHHGSAARGEPARVATVFAGADVEATNRARSYFTGYPPSSPCIGFLRDGKLQFILERRNIENQTAEQIAVALTKAFDTYCGAGATPSTQPA